MCMGLHVHNVTPLFSLSSFSAFPARFLPLSPVSALPTRLTSTEEASAEERDVGAKLFENESPSSSGKW